MSDFQVVPYSEKHAIPLLEQSINVHMKEFFLKGHARELEKGPSVALLYKGEPMLVGGILPVWEGRGQVWCMFSEKSKYHAVAVFRHLKRFTTENFQKFYRIEVCVPYDFEYGKRRVEMLGFELDCARAKKYLPGGGDAAVYSAVRS